jgi:sugar lactone lactonase YvrE
VAGGAKLVRIDLASDRVRRVYTFNPGVVPERSYLNDVRIDPAHNLAFITDSGMGALIVLDLGTGEAHRLLAGHPSMMADPELVPVIGGRELRGPDGRVPQIHSDGIALDLERRRLYLHALTERRLFAIDNPALLRDPVMIGSRAAELVRDMGETVVTDGMLAGPSGEVYHTALEQDAIVAWWPDGRLETVIQDPRIAWPDSMAWGAEGAIYFTTSQIHLTPPFGEGREEPFRVFRLALSRSSP